MHLSKLAAWFYQIDMAMHCRTMIPRCLCSVLINSKIVMEAHIYLQAECKIYVKISNCYNRPKLEEKNISLLCNRSSSQHDFNTQRCHIYIPEHREGEGGEVRIHVNSKGKISSTRKIFLRGGLNPRHCINQDTEPNTVPMSYFSPCLLTLKLLYREGQ